jgi:hypothetical protein
MCVRFYNDPRPTCQVPSIINAYRLKNGIRGNVGRQIEMKSLLK